MYIQLFILTAAIRFQEKQIKCKDNSCCLAFQILYLKGNLEAIALAPKCRLTNSRAKVKIADYYKGGKFEYSARAYLSKH